MKELYELEIVQQQKGKLLTAKHTKAMQDYLLDKKEEKLRKSR